MGEKASLPLVADDPGHVMERLGPELTIQYFNNHSMGFQEVRGRRRGITLVTGLERHERKGRKRTVQCFRSRL